MCPLFKRLYRESWQWFLSLSEDLLFLCCPQETQSQTSGIPVFQPLTSHWPPNPLFRPPFFSFHHRLQPSDFRLTLSNQNPPKLEPPELSPGGLQLSSKTAPTSAPQGLLLLGSRRLPPAGSRVTTQGSVPFSKKSDTFRDELTRLGLTFPLTWQDIMVTLAPCCTCNGKEQRLTNARRPSDGLLAASQHHLTYQAGGDEPRTWPMLGLYRRCRQAGRRHYATCLSETMKRHIVKPLNYDKIREVTQEKDESLAVFLSQVTDTWGRTLTQTLSRQKGDH